MGRDKAREVKGVARGVALAEGEADVVAVTSLVPDLVVTVYAPSVVIKNRT
jgi:hypothetical protein